MYLKKYLLLILMGVLFLTGCGGTNSQTLEDKITDSFKISVDGKKHKVEIVYSIIDTSNDSTTYGAEIYYDGVKMKDFGYTNTISQNPYDEYDAKNPTFDEIKKYTLKDLEDFRITKDDFKLIKGNNDKTYLGIYGYNQYIEGWDSKLYILDSKGASILTLTDATSMSISKNDASGKYLKGYNYEWENNFGRNEHLTKVENNEIYFYAIEPKEQTTSTHENVVVTEYKLTLGDKLKFDRVNTYNDASLSGDVSYELNDVISK